VPIAGYAELSKGKVHMRGIVGEVDGSKILSSNQNSVKMTVEVASKLGEEVAKSLLSQGAGNILDELYELAQEKRERELEIAAQEALVAKQEVELNLENKKKLILIRLLKLNDYTDVVFVSRNAVEIGMPLINKYGGLPDHIRALSVGAETAKQLYRYGIDAMFPGSGSGADALLKVGQLSDLTNRKILIVRGDNSLVWPEEKMRKRGAEVDNMVVYYQTTPPDCIAKLNAIFKNDYHVEGVFAHSSQSVINLIDSAGDYFEDLAKIKMVAGSKRIAQTALDYGWKGDILIAQSPSNKHMMITFSG